MSHQQYSSAIEACNACADACDHAVTACLQEQSASSQSRGIALGIDTAQICRLLASFMSRDSEMTSYLSKFCEETCEAAAEEFGKGQADYLQQATKACRRCADETRRLAVKMPGARAAQSQQPAQSQSRPSH